MWTYLFSGARLGTPVSLLVLSGLTPWAAQAQSDTPAAREVMGEVVVTAVADKAPLTVVTDPKLPRQPVPASDAADYLKTIPGFSSIRSAGTHGDPVFRGMFGSRLAILTNGSTTLGGCGGRMDAPSSYIAPQTYDVLTLVKGPQTVLWGGGASAGVVRFDRLAPDFSQQNIHFEAQGLVGSHGRNDQMVDVSAGTEKFYARLTANRSESQDYEDGDGQEVPSKWKKWSTDLALGLTPDPDTWIELSLGVGDAEARYGGRAMDGSKFRRESAGLRFEKRNLSDWLSRVEAQVYYNYADHVMDNYTLRPYRPSGSMSMPMDSNPDRRTMGGRSAATWVFSKQWQLVTGLDYQQNERRFRSGSPSMIAYTDKPRVRDARYEQLGVFAELNWKLAPRHELISGLRVDRVEVKRYPSTSAAQAAANNQRRRSLPSGFMRWEHQLLQPQATVYAGLGHAQRFPDYWELISPSNSAANAGNAFGWLKPEQTTQLDIGAQWSEQGLKLWSSAYAAYIKDYILHDYGTGSARVRNVDAEIAGAELGLNWQFAPSWNSQLTLAYAWGRRVADHQPLPQMPPLEARLNLNYQAGAWSAGVLWRLVAAQHRYAPQLGNVVGRDFGPSGGFGVVSLNSAYALSKNYKISVGLDNVLDKRYAEHLNRMGNSGFGYSGTLRLQEPGRTFWLRGDVKF